MSGNLRALWWVLVFVSLPLAAQESGEDQAAEQGPDAASSAETADEQARERDNLEPGVPSAVLAEDVRRRRTGAGGVMDEMELDRTEITGNQELPKVLYIVPWKKSDPGDLMGRPVNTLLDEVLEPLDREEFIRQVNYYDNLYGEEGE